MAPTLNCNHEAPYIAHSLRGEGFDASEDGTGRGTPLVPVAFQSSQSGVRLDDVHATLDSNNGSRRHNGILSFDATQITSAANCSNPQPGDPSHTLSKGAHASAIACDYVMPTMLNGANTPAGHSARSGHTKDAYIAPIGMQVRRLTPEECEALQGFPRGYTVIPHRGKPAADGPRYKALGNSWAVPCAAWIGRRIDAVARIKSEQAAIEIVAEKVAA